jgi:hypothetical protein
LSPGARTLLAALLSLPPLTALAQTHGYAAGFDTLYRVNLATAQAERIGAITVGGSAVPVTDVEGLALSRDNVLYGVADGTPGGGLYRIDVATAQATLVGNLGLQGQGAPPNDNLDVGLAFTCDGRLWLSSDTAAKLWEVDPGTGATRLAGALGKKISGLGARADGLYGIGVDGDNGIYRIDTTNGTAALIGPLSSGTQLPDAGLDFAADGTLWAVLDRYPPARTSDLAQIDPTTGQESAARTVSGPGLDDKELEALAIAPPVCAPTGVVPPSLPVPAVSGASLGTLILGVLLVAWLAWRRRGLALR